MKYCSIIMLLCGCLLSGCSWFSSSAVSVLAPPTSSDHILHFSTLPDSKALQVSSSSGDILPENPVYALNVKECSEKRKGSLAGHARSLYVGMKDLTLRGSELIEHRIPILKTDATATFGHERVQLIGYTWEDNECIYDFLFWTPVVLDQSEAILNSGFSTSATSYIKTLTEPHENS